MNTVLEVKDLCKTYVVNKRQNNVLCNLELTVNEGEMVAVMGPSGSGKSTLLYTVSGMDKMTAGSVKFCGRDMADMKENELAEMRLDDMGFIFQQMYMMKNLTVLDNIILPAVKSKKHKESRTSSEEVMEELTKLNEEGTTIMLVTHDAKVAAKCSRVLFIVDGSIKGEFSLDRSKPLRDREKELNNWLIDMGW